VSSIGETTGTIVKILGNNNYLVEVEIGENKKELLCHLGGKMRQIKINVIPGDEVTVEIPAPFDKGRITYRGKKSDRPARKKMERRKKGRKR
jgi:translation initiation factor IF-1